MMESRLGLTTTAQPCGWCTCTFKSQPGSRARLGRVIQHNRRDIKQQSAGKEDNGGGTGQATEEKRAEPRLQDPAQTVVWGGTLPSRRRAITGGLSGLAIVLIGNLGGVTSALLGLDGGKLAGKLHADVLIPVKGFKRCLDSQNGFDDMCLTELQYPAAWLADQSIFRRNAEKRERLGGLDPPSASRRQRDVAEPVAAFGPAGSTGELNVSVIIAPIQAGFQLSSLGGPTEVGERFLNQTIAPPRSSLQAKLITASER